MAEFIRNAQSGNTERRVRPTHTQKALAQKITMCHLIGNFDPNHPNLNDVYDWMDSKGMLTNGRPNKTAVQEIGLGFLTITSQVNAVIDVLNLLTNLTNQGKFNMADLGLDYALDSFLRAQEKMQDQIAQNLETSVETSVEASYEVIQDAAQTTLADTFFAPTDIALVQVEEVQVLTVPKTRKKVKA